MAKTANIHGTDGVSLTVGLPKFGFEATRRKLIAKRVILGPNTPKGHACSNLVEQLAAYRAATGDQKANLERLIPVQMRRLTSQ